MAQLNLTLSNMLFLKLIVEADIARCTPGDGEEISRVLEISLKKKRNILAGIESAIYHDEME